MWLPKYWADTNLSCIVTNTESSASFPFEARIRVQVMLKFVGKC